jgi:hypothetical protein
MAPKSAHLKAHNALTGMLARYVDELLARTPVKDPGELENQKKRLLMASGQIADLLDKFLDYDRMNDGDQELLGSALANAIGAAVIVGAFLIDHAGARKFQAHKQAALARKGGRKKHAPVESARKQAIETARGGEPSAHQFKEANQHLDVINATLEAAGHKPLDVTQIGKIIVKSFGKATPNQGPPKRKRSR